MTPDAPARLLERYGRELQPVGPLRSIGGAGGLSGSRLWRYASVSGERLIRAWPEGPSVGRIETIHGWLREAADLAFVPQPFPARDGRTVQQLQGTCWEVAPWLSGTADANRPPGSDRVRAAFRALAEFHARLSKGSTLGPSPGLNRCVGELEALTRGGFESLEFELIAAADDPNTASALAWVRLARRAAPAALKIVRESAQLATPLQPCLRDARPEHFLFEGDRMSGLVDFGAMDIESVAADLARLAGEWLPLPDCRSLRTEGIKSYLELQHFTFDQIGIMAAFEAAADVLIAERWIRWQFLEHRLFDERRIVADGIGRGLERLRRFVGRLT